MAERFEDKRINEALELLNEVAQDKKAELQNIVADKHSNLKAVLGEVVEGWRHQTRGTYKHGKEKIN